MFKRLPLVMSNVLLLLTTDSITKQAPSHNYCPDGYSIVTLETPVNKPFNVKC